MKIPLVDLAWQHREIEREVREGLDRVVAEGSFILGPEVRAFEEEFARASGVAHGVGVANGTDALELALRALEIGAGDEVIVPANSFVASALAIARAGATPVFVDCDPVTQLIDVEACLDRVGPRTRAVMPVNLFGQIAPIERLRDALEGGPVAIVEDAAQSQGARRHGSASGSFGVVAGTSFYPGKNLGAWGDAGAVVTDDAEIARKLRCLRNYGSEKKYEHPETGFNSRLDSVQAVVLRAKLRRLDAWNALRREAALRYDALLEDVPDLVRPTTLPGNEHVWHLYAVRVPRRDELLRSLQEAGIGAGIHYPVPIHLQGAFAEQGHVPGDFPEAERAAGELLSLPLYPGIEAAQQEQVASAIAAARAAA